MAHKDKEKTYTRVPVGVERVLYLAATDAAFKRALARDPEAAVSSRGLDLRPSELAMLRAVPLEQLLASVTHMDASPENLKRRSFLHAVAASAVTVAAADALSGCSDQDTSKGIRPDMGHNQTAGISPDMPASVKDAGNDLVAAPDHKVTSNGIRPGNDVSIKIKADMAHNQTAGISPDLPSKVKDGGSKDTP